MTDLKRRHVLAGLATLALNSRNAFAASGESGGFRSFATLAEAQTAASAAPGAAEYLKPGTFVHVSHYAASGDGGGFLGFVHQDAELYHPAQSRIAPATDQPLAPEMWGAAGNYDPLSNAGTDDYDAWQQLAAFCRAQPAGTAITIRCTPGARYYWNRTKINRDYGIVPYPFPQGSSGHGDVYFSGNQSLDFDLNGAAIYIKGDFHRPFDDKAGKRRYSHTRNISLTFRNIGRLRLANGFIDGRVDLMSRDQGVNAGACHGVNILSCGTATVENMTIQRFAGDSLLVGGWSFRGDGLDGNQTRSRQRIITDRLEMRRTTLIGSGRQGLSIVGVGTTRIEDGCRFAEIGNTGQYGAHKPSAGIDVEPNPQNDRPTGAVEIMPGTVFENCLGHPLTANYLAMRVVVDGAIVSRSRVEQSEYFRIAARSALVTRCDFRNVAPAPTFGAKKTREINVEILDNTIVHRLPVPKRNWLYDKPGFNCVWRRNRIVIATGQPLQQKVFLAPAEFTDNTIEVDAACHPGYGGMLLGRITSGRQGGNTFSTNLTTPGAWFYINSRKARQVGAPRFVGNFSNSPRKY